MKIKFNTDDNISLNKDIYFPTITIIIRSVTQKYSYMNVCIKNFSNLCGSERTCLCKA